jgi:hypothetical protein
MTYKEKLLDPRWQKKRLEVLNRDNFRCQHCHHTDKTLHVHHLCYRDDFEPWEYSEEYLLTLCVDCHEKEGVDKKADDVLIKELFSIRFKDSFTRKCLIEGMDSLKNFDYIVYLLWEMRDNPDDIVRALIELNGVINPIELPTKEEWQELGQ